jgi:hypothetical protein
MMYPMCWKCGKAITIDGPVGRSSSCPSCGADVRSCKNCRHWSPGGWHDCAERQNDEVRDKERANFCDAFQLNPAFRKDHPAGNGSAKASAAKDSARASFDGLFNS